KTSQCDIKKRGEGEYHYKGKLLLYEWLKSQQKDVKLEAYIPEIKQRPDLLLTVKNKQIAIEFQCATIDPQIIFQRNKGYRRANIIPILILGAIYLVVDSPIIFIRVISLLSLFIVSHIIISLLYFSFVHNLINYPSFKILFLQILTELLQNKLLFHLIKRHFIICF